MKTLIIFLSLLCAVFALEKCKDWPKVIKGPSSASVELTILDASLEHDLIITGGSSDEAAFGKTTLKIPIINALSLIYP